MMKIWNDLKIKWYKDSSASDMKHVLHCIAIKCMFLTKQEVLLVYAFQSGCKTTPTLVNKIKRYKDERK